MSTFQLLHRKVAKGILVVMPLAAAACGGSSGPPPATLSLSLSTSTVVSPQDGTPAQLGVIISGAAAGSSVQVTVSGLPSGVTSQFSTNSGGPSGTVAITSGPSVAAGAYTGTVGASSSTQSVSQSFTLVVAVAAIVGSAVDSTLGVNGKLQEFMATSFQPAEWDFQFFQNHPNATAPLNNLGSQHIRLQFLSRAVPMKANTNAASDWDFTMLDAIVQPVLGVADHSPELQIAVAPSFLNDTNGHLIVNSANLNTFAQYCANLVKYYNTGGFSWGGTVFRSASTHPITWWGIFNEYNINGLTPSEYVQLYNVVVPAMLAADPKIKLSALELSDFDFGVGDPRNNLPTFVAPAASGGVKARVDVASTHFYSSCNQKDTDSQVFGSVSGFVNDVKYFYQQLATRPDLAGVPVWVTENNVNADFSDQNGNSVCNPSQKFVADQRGTSAFFAAWRPYVFSQLGKAGNQALYHWDYDADAQFGEVDFGTANTYLSYWVDFWLAKMFPSTPSSPGPDILQLTVTETSTVELLATKNSDGSVVLMVADRAVRSSTDNNGPGDPRTLILDVSSLGTFATATALTIDSSTSAGNGPAAMSITPAKKMSVTLGGYGVTFLTLKP
jgi:hypothetical protein